MYAFYFFSLRKKVGGPERALEYERILLEWFEAQFTVIKVL
jgi:hypothetical protein